MDIEKLQNRIIFWTKIQLFLKIIVLAAIAWISVEAILYIGEHGLKDLIDLIWLGPDIS